jgi:hypothetical protein
VYSSSSVAVDEGPIADCGVVEAGGGQLKVQDEPDGARGAGLDCVIHCRLTVRLGFTIYLSITEATQVKYSI